MLLLVVWIVLALLLLAAAIAEVFWPITALAVIAIVATWTVNSALLWTLWNPLGITLYLAIGLGWVFFKWTRFVEAKLKEEQEEKAQYAAHVVKMPQWSKHWDDFVGHYFWWPFSMLAYITSDLLTQVWEWLSKMVTKSFDAYAKWRFRSLMEQ